MRRMVKNENRKRNLKKLEKHMEYFLILRKEHVMTMVKILRIWKAWPVSDAEINVYRFVIYTSWTIMCMEHNIIFLFQFAYSTSVVNSKIIDIVFMKPACLKLFLGIYSCWYIFLP